MNFLDTAVVILCLTGLSTLLAGILISKYPREGRFLRLKYSFSLEHLSNIKPVKAVLELATGNRKGKIYRFSSWIINNSESQLNVQTLYILKVITVIAITMLVLLVRHTNMEAMKESIISKSSEAYSIFEDKGETDYAFNTSLYNAVIKKIGIQELKNMDDGGRLEASKAVIGDFIQTKDSQFIEDKALTFVKTYNAVNNIRLFNWTVILMIILSFWIPEALLFLKKLLLSNRYKKEVIKLENIFELLGSIKGFKTIDIIDEMGKSSKPYKKHLRNCMELFKTEKELALESLKTTVKNNRFSKLVDVMRIYALVDKDLALKILERNKHEKEEEALLTAEEDIDVVDVVAFISVIPILLEIANLLMKPMLDMIYQAFQYI